MNEREGVAMADSEPAYAVIRFKDRDIFNLLGPNMAEDIRTMVQKGMVKVFGREQVHRIDMERLYEVPGTDIRVPGTDTLFLVNGRDTDMEGVVGRLLEEAVMANDRIEMINRGRLGAIRARCPQITRASFEIYDLVKKQGNLL
jgi:hypothetical protein